MSAPAGCTFVPLNELDKLAIPTAHGTFLDKLNLLMKANTP
jgi:hypothetical protein